MLRHTKTSWNCYWGEPYKSINDLKQNGEFIVAVKPDGEALDPGVEGLDDFVGSHCWLTQRTLGYNRISSVYGSWMSQVAYSYFNPEIAVRCHTGLNTTPENQDRWTPWEFTVMSGIFKETVTLLNSRGKMDLTRNRNSNIVSIHVYNVNLEINVNVGRIHIGYITSPGFRPSFSVVLPLLTASVGSSGYAVLECCLVIDATGNVYIYNEQKNATTLGNIIEQTLTYNLY